MEHPKRQTVPPILTTLARALGTRVKNRRLDIPKKFGAGYCTGYLLNEHIRMFILHYALHENIIIENPGVNPAAKTILFKFHNVFPPAEPALTPSPFKAPPAVLIATSRINTDAAIPIHTHTAVINIDIDAQYLNGLFDTSRKSPVLQSLLENTQPLLFEQMIYPSLQKVIDEILTESVDETFKLLYLRIKAEELVCKLLIELEQRDEKRLYPLNHHDVQTLYSVKAQIIQNLETPPVIDVLAAGANMSPTKLKRLFKQIFGNSIFAYYQEFRMKEAARLLTDGKHAVSAAGSMLGFTNLSHFARIFEEHTGMKPKQYQKQYAREV